MKRKKLIQTIALSLIIMSTSTYLPSSLEFIEEVHAIETLVDRPMFDSLGIVEINGIKYKKTADTTVSIYHCEDYTSKIISIPSQISVNDVRYTVTSIADKAFKGLEGYNGGGSFCALCNNTVKLT